MKRIVTVQDISCVGKCSLTVALPIISAMGIETAVLPTAVLSAHTAFSGFTFHDLTADIAPITRHWQAENIGFDAIYTGYLGSFEQLQLMSDFFGTFKKEGTLVFLDPVMGDFGKLYPGFSSDFALAMADLCSKADIIVPNLTEASYMLRIPYCNGEYDEAYIQDILCRLTSLGTKKAVLTGVSFEPNTVGVMAYDSETQNFFSYFRERINATYHGTGDVFASSCLGALMNGKTLEDALQIATDYTVESIYQTEKDPDRRWYGINFESSIPYLLGRLHNGNL